LDVSGICKVDAAAPSIPIEAHPLTSLEDDCRRLLPHLLTCGGHEEEATELQKEMFEFETTFGKGIDEIWASPERSQEAQKEEAAPTPIGIQSLERKVDPREKHPKPNVAELRWSYSILSSTY
jgi:elongator complex protein 1